jgi:predicted lipid-binding transport protein (Tim44 family)
VKKLLLLTFLVLFAVSTVCAAAPSSSSRPASAPKPSTSQTAPATSPSSGYKPSAPASSYSNTAPKPAAPQPAQQPATGGWMRTLGMLGSGMLIGGLLSSLFGFGNSGMFASIIGILANVVLLAGIFMAGRFLWTKYKEHRAETQRRT